MRISCHARIVKPFFSGKKKTKKHYRMSPASVLIGPLKVYCVDAQADRNVLTDAFSLDGLSLQTFDASFVSYRYACVIYLFIY